MGLKPTADLGPWAAQSPLPQAASQGAGFWEDLTAMTWPGSLESPGPVLQVFPSCPEPRVLLKTALIPHSHSPKPADELRVRRLWKSASRRWRRAPALFVLLMPL